MTDDLIAAVDVAGVPLQVGLAADIARAINGRAVELRGLAAALRREKATFDSDPDARAYLTPALVARTLTPAAGVIATTALPDHRRVLGARSPRVDMLQTLLSLLDLEDTTHIRQLVRRMAATVPEASPPGEPLETDRVRRAVRPELDVIVPDDDRERETAAERLAAHGPSVRFYGHPRSWEQVTA